MHRPALCARDGHCAPGRCFHYGAFLEQPCMLALMGCACERGQLTCRGSCGLGLGGSLARRLSELGGLGGGVLLWLGDVAIVRRSL